MFKFPDGLHYVKYSSSNKNKPGVNLNPAEIRGRRLVIAALIFAVVLGSDLVWVMGEESLSVIAELIEEGVERFYSKTIGLDTYHAQMASAYTYLIVAAALGVWLSHRAFITLRRVQHTGYLWWCAFSDAAHQIWRERVSDFLAWWSLQDWLNKVAVVVACLVIAVPLILLLSLALGGAVAELL